MYRINLYLPLAPIFREKKFGYAREILDSLNQQLEDGAKELIWGRSFRLHRTVPVDVFKDAQNLYMYFTNKDYDTYMLRVEQSYLMWYSNDEAQFNEIIDKFEDRVYEVHKPDPSVKAGLQPNVIIKDSKYRYKVTVGPTVDPNVAYWFESNPDKVRIGKTFLQAIKDGQYVKGFYFYVKNEKVLNLVKIILGGRIQRIDKFVSKLEL